MREVFIGREKELADLNELYAQHRFQMFVLYGRRRVGKTTLLNEFCKDKESIFYSAEQSNDKLNLNKFSALVFQYYQENNLEPFSSWTNALSYIDEHQKEKRLVLVIDEFPYLVRKNRALLSELQHLIDGKLKSGNLFIVLCGSYMGFMEKEVLGSKSPLFGRRTGQLHMKPFSYQTGVEFLEAFSDEEKLEQYEGPNPRPADFDAYWDKALEEMRAADPLMFTGLMDQICPPSTQYAAYNKMTCKKRHILYPDFGHEWLRDADDIIFDFFVNQ